ncbi:MAG: tetratricopeptide repeat protein [Verrucomicrobiota bacterium]
MNGTKDRSDKLHGAASSGRNLADRKAGATDGRPRQAVPVSYTTTWMYFLLIISLAVAWSFPIRHLVNHYLWPPVEHGKRDNHEFVALAYRGVSGKDDEVSPALFREHLDALRDNGYVPIDLEDVRGLVYEGKPVPEKAVLMTFDHSRKTSYFFTRGPLKRAGWNAVMFLWLYPVDTKDKAALRWPYIDDMVRSRRWEVGIQSYNGFEEIPGSPRGKTGRFLTTPRWIKEEKRYETVAEFQARLATDHKKCIGIMEEELGFIPNAYAYPYGDFGQYRPKAIVIRTFNLALASKHYDLAFLRGELALNTKYSDPRRLNRLIVRPEWSGDDLVDFLEKSWSKNERAVKGLDEMLSSSWIVDWGAMRQADQGGLHIYAPYNTTGARMWLGGSNLARDFHARVKFRLEEGQLGLYMRATSDGVSYTYLGIDEGGYVRIQQKERGDSADDFNGEEPVRRRGIWFRQKRISELPFTLASSEFPLDPEQEHTLDIYLRGNYLFARINGQDIFAQAGLLRGEQDPGMFGVSVWSPDKGRASAQITGLQLDPQKPAIASWNTGVQNDGFVFKWISSNAHLLTDLSPVWIQATTMGEVISGVCDADFYGKLADVHRLDFCPQVRADGVQGLSHLSPSYVVEQAQQKKVDGLYLNFRNMRDVSMSRMGTWLKQCGGAIENTGMKLLLALPESMETRSGLSSVLAVLPNVQFVLAKDSRENQEELGVSEKDIAEEKEAPEPGPGEDLPFLYMIPMSAGTNGEMTVEAKASRLRRDGMAAYVDENYEKAIDQWAQWLEINPDNSRALMYLGDAYSKQGNANKALEYYDRSLDINPGDISLAIRKCKLLQNIGRAEEASRVLNLYARLFPENVDIMSAQIEWLMEEGRKSEARLVAKKVLELDPDNINVLAVMVRLSRSPAETRRFMARLVEAGRDPRKYTTLGHAIRENQLLANPHAEDLVELVLMVSRTAEEPAVKDMFSLMEPRVYPVVDDLTGGAGGNWRITGGNLETDRGYGILKAGRSYSEAAMRLTGSMRLKNSFIEARIGDVDGDFWLYGARTMEHLVRFGFTPEGRVHLQFWKDGNLVHHKVKDWTRTGNQMTIRLEVRSGGAMGYINGEQMFGTVLDVPPEASLGWSGIGVHKEEKGRARASVYRLSGGPLPTRIAFLNYEKSEEKTDEELEQVRPLMPKVSAICPRWFEITGSGQWGGSYPGRKHIYYLFAKYHKVSLLPVVRVAEGAVVEHSRLIDKMESVEADGFCILFNEMPSSRWINGLKRDVANLRYKVMLGIYGPGGDVIRVNELNPNSDPDKIGRSLEILRHAKPGKDTEEEEDDS